jgi:hypothetical protein
MKFYNFLKSNIFYIVVLIVGASYVLLGMSNIMKSGKDITTIISDGALTTFLGLLISGLLRQQGIQKGLLSDTFLSALDSLAVEVGKVESNTRKLDEFLEIENKQKMIRKRSRLLDRVGVTYDDYCKRDYKGDKAVKKIFKRCDKIKQGYLTSDWLLADVEDEDERNEKKPTITGYVVAENFKGAFTKILTGGISAYYVLEPFANANINTILWRLFFFFLMVLSGVLAYSNAYTFIARLYRQTIVNKRKTLLNFQQWLNSQN